MTVTANLYCNLAAYANRTYSVGECLASGGNAYQCTTPGTTPTAPSGTSTTPVSFGLGTSKWVWLSAITFSGATADAVFSAALAGATSVGGLTGSVTQPIIWQCWYTGATWQTSAVGIPFLTLTGHSFTSTNRFTLKFAQGRSIRDQGAAIPGAFNASFGSFTLPNAVGTQNYFNIYDPNVTFDGLQFKDPITNSDSTIIKLNPGANNFHLRNSIVEGTAQSSALMVDIGAGTASNLTGILFTNCLFVDHQAANTNTAPIKDGTSSATSVTFVNCTHIAINPQNAAAAVVANGTGANSWIMRNCVAMNYGTGLLASPTGCGDVEYCGTDANKVLNVAGGTIGSGNLISQTAANMFVSTTADFRLKIGSPFLNTAILDSTNIPANDDLFRTSRPQGSTPDMGAFEFPLAYAASLADTIAASENRIVALGFPATRSDTAASSDTFNVTLNFVAELSDSLAIDDSAISVIFGFVQNLDEPAIATEVLIPSAFSLSQTVETVFTNDLYRSIGAVFSATLADSVATDDLYPPSFGLQDTAIASDNIFVSFNAISVFEVAVTSDSYIPFLNATVSVVDTTLLTENYTTSYNAGFYAVSLADITATSDSAKGSGATSAIGCFQIGVSPLGSHGLANLELAETAITSDISTNNGTADILDSVTTSDSFEGSGATSEIDYFQIGISPIEFLGLANLSLTENAVTSDSFAIDSSHFTLTDSSNINDSLTFRRGFKLVLSDAIISSDALSRIAARLSLADTLITSDAPLGKVHGVGSFADVTAANAVPLLIGSSQRFTDAITIHDTLIGSKSATWALNDNVGNHDTLSTTHHILATLGDTVVGSDHLNATLTIKAIKLIDISNTHDAITALIVNESAHLTDTLAAIDKLNYVIYVAAFGDVIAIDDALDGIVMAPLHDITATFDALVNEGILTAQSIIVTSIPTGGAVLIQFPGYFPPSPRATDLTVSRSVTGSGIWATIYHGPPIGVFIDVGDGLPGPLDPATSYIWRVSDYSGNVISESITPSSYFLSEPDQLTQILLRLLQGALNSMTLPPGIKRPLLTIKMPTNGMQAMPFIVVNLDLIQQTEVAIGEDVPQPTNDNIWTLFANAKRLWRVTIVSPDAEERDFFRDTLLSVFRVLKATAFGPLGQNVTHTFQAASYSSVQEYQGISPGFYCADLMLEIDGLFPTAVLTNYLPIRDIEADPTYEPYEFSIRLTDP